MASFLVRHCPAWRLTRKREAQSLYAQDLCCIRREARRNGRRLSSIVYEGREIKFCCKGCLKDFKKDPAKYIKMIEEAEAKAKKDKR